MRRNVRRIGATLEAGDPSSIGMLPVPNPRLWPAEIRTWYRNATGECGPLDIFLFDYGDVGSLYLQDAITAAAVLSVDASEWHTERGFPVFVFDASRIGEIQHRLGLCGYTVRMVQPAAEPKRSKRRRAPVVDIGSGRKKRKDKKRNAETE